MSQLVIQVEDVPRKRRARFVFDRSPVHLGRSELNDLVIPLPMVSLWHGVIRFTDDAIRYVDAGSSNGTAVNGTTLKRNQAVVLGPDQEVVIGPLKFKFSLEEDGKGKVSDNAAQREQIFGEAQVEPSAVAGHTRFFNALQLQPPPEREDTASKRSPARAPKQPAPPPESTVMISAFTPGPAPAERPAAAPESLGALDEAYGQFHSSVACVQRQLSTLLAGKSDADRRATLARIIARYPLLSEGNLLTRWAPTKGSPGSGPRSLPGESPSVVVNELGLNAPATAARSPENVGLRLLNQFAACYVAKRPRLDSAAQVEGFLDRLAQVLEAFTKSFIELRRGYESFGEQMGVGEVSRHESRISSFDSIQRVLEYLLDENQSDGRVGELTRGFADVMIHQVALVGGIREGVREVLDMVSPEAIEELARRKGRGSFISALVPAQKHWALFAVQHRELLDDEEQLTQTLFGKAFARAYAEVARGGGAPSEDDEG